jgi:hypothetical protein
VHPRLVQLELFKSAWVLEPVAKVVRYALPLAPPRMQLDAAVLFASALAAVAALVVM